MHQIQFRQGLCTIPRSESLQRSPDPLAGFRERERKGDVKGRRGEGRKGKRREKTGKGEGRGKGNFLGPCLHFSCMCP